MNHILKYSPFAEIFVLRYCNVHHQLCLSFFSTDQPGERAHNFAFLHGLEQLIQHLLTQRITDHLGDTPNILDLFVTLNPSAYSVLLFSLLGSFNGNLISLSYALPPA